MSKGFLLSKNSTNVRTIKLEQKLFLLGLRLLGGAVPELAARRAAEMFLTPRRHRRPEREQELISNGTAFHVDWKGRRLAAWYWGSGPAILLVHGWEGRGAQLGSFIARLAESGYRVVAFDGPGHGDSEGERSSVVEMADAVRTVAEEIGPLHGIVAHSMGAAATAVAMRGGLDARRLVFIAPPSRLADFARRFTDYLGLSPEIAGRVQKIVEARFKVEWSKLNVHAIAGTMEAPLLIVHDQEDEEVLWENGREIADSWPGARLITTTGLGHRRILHNKNVIEQAVNFINSHQTEESPTSNRVSRDKSGRNQICRKADCSNPVENSWDETGLLCSSCAMERELYDPETRWRSHSI